MRTGTDSTAAILVHLIFVRIKNSFRLLTQLKRRFFFYSFICTRNSELLFFSDYEYMNTSSHFTNAIQDSNRIWKHYWLCMSSNSKKSSVKFEWFTHIVSHISIYSCTRNLISASVSAIENMFIYVLRGMPSRSCMHACMNIIYTFRCGTKNE